jgi:hypothetical protein
LTGHNLGVGAGDLDTSVEAGLVVSVGDGTTEGDVGTSGAVVGTLSTGVAIVGPAEGLFGELGAGVKESVLLFNTVPGLLLLDGGLVPDLASEVSEVGVGWDELLASIVLPVPCFAHNQNVVAASEWIFVESDRLKDDLTLICDGLVGAAAVIVPFWNLSKGLDWGVKCSCLRSECDARTVNPNVLGDDLSVLVNAKKILGVLVVEVVRVGNHLKDLRNC